ncbi:MAG: lysine 2,3-aminomutase [Methanospirillum sp.]|nr:lysine 2,3-aminomutase [Methanospirillum sp.]
MVIFSPKQKAIASRIEADVVADTWKDWRWQVARAVTEIDEFERLLGIEFDAEERARLDETVRKFPLRITPYYLSLIDPSDIGDDPIYRQCFPDPAELYTDPGDMTDPLAEDKDSPAPCITHRYPDRVLFLVSNLCAMYCRHCTRKRRVGDVDSIPDREEIDAGLDYIRRTPGIRDVLLSGGDPLMLPDDYLDWILTELDGIPHVEVVRIGTRAPVTLPYRVTEDLAAMLSQHHPLWVNTHFNHPVEMTTSSKLALRRLADAGIPLGNQSVLLAGVNDCPRIIKRLVQLLVQNRVRPYYLYQCDLSEGLTHFRTPVSKGIEILENLIGHTSGFSIPTFVIDAPGGGGKIPLMPTYLISWATNRVVLRNYEGMICSYREPDSYEPAWCDRQCHTCDRFLKLEGADESQAVGICQLLSEEDPTIALIPENTARIERRDGS